jgi:hypothetical protein
MDQRISGVLVAAVLAVLAGTFLIPPTDLARTPWILAAPAALGIGHGLVVVWLGGRIGSSSRPDLVRWVALSYGFVLAAVLIGLAIPFFRSVLVMGLAFIAGVIAPLRDERLVVRSAAGRRGDRA